MPAKGENQGTLRVQLTEHSQPVFLESALVPITLGFIKLSFFLFYLQIFWLVRWFRICCYIGIFVTCAFHGGATITQLVFAVPRSGQTWATHLLSPITLRQATLAVPMSAVGLGVDIVLFVLPIRVVMQMRLNGWERMRAYLMFGTGAL